MSLPGPSMVTSYRVPSPAVLTGTKDLTNTVKTIHCPQ